MAYFHANRQRRHIQGLEGALRHARSTLEAIRLALSDDKKALKIARDLVEEELKAIDAALRYET